MAKELGSFTPNPTGNTTLTLNGSFTPTWIDFWVGPRTGTTETVNMASFGCVDITNGNATWQSNFSGSTNQTKNGVGSSTGTSCLQHYNPANTKVIDIKFVSAASGQFVVDVVTANVNYTVYYRVEG